MSSSRVKYVDHTYRDFSRYTEDGGQLIKHKKSEANFPAKLHKMLSEPCYSHIITWMPHGRAFKIIDKDLLFNSVLPQYYVCNKYESFTRQLNAWGFKRMYQSGPDSGCYYHECFLRGLPKLTCLIRRLPQSQGKSTPYPAGEPNLYKISVKFPLPPAGSPNVSVKPPAVEESATATSSLDRSSRSNTHSQIHPSSFSMQLATHGYSPGLRIAPSVHTPTQSRSYEPLNQESVAFSASATLRDRASWQDQSTEVQYPSFSSPGASAVPSRIAYEPPHRMSHTEGYQYSQPPAQSSFSHASSTPTNYMLPFGHSGQHFYSSYGQQLTQGQNTQYQYQSQGQNPQYQYQTPQYTFQDQSHERPRFRYPPPQLPQYLSFTPRSVAPIGGQLQQGTYHHYRGNNLDTGQPLPHTQRIHGSHEGDTKSPEWPSRNMDDDGLMTEPLPYSLKSDSDSPAYKKLKPDPPP